MIRVTRFLGGAGAVCRVLSGQRYPEVSREQGIEWVVECIEAVLPAAREQGVILGLENHYKDGFWTFPEFAQKMDVFLELLEAIPEREYFGVQYDPSNAHRRRRRPRSNCCAPWPTASSACTPATAFYPPAPPWQTCAPAMAQSAIPMRCSTG